jgi:predicted nuclease of predicted toxin-antitoxin system
VILADENIDRLMIAALRDHGLEVISIKERYQGYKDEQIVELSKNPPAVILTNDKDFGNWVFAHGVKDVSVVLLRARFTERLKMIDIVVKLFLDHLPSLRGKFTTVTVNRIRTTSLRS